ncbi:hypothetical protein [Paracoccus yeei]|uniref:Uncharacterized protein n=1 Tax=Paracoccus yeei TaxID=147645 RepID=A0A2D2C411_9RHOB|nr:hypothetical protein [Paracoccus yeei]ATQ57242.1 hypothetical protein PYTT13_16520 [Paracoccus yeei]
MRIINLAEGRDGSDGAFSIRLMDAEGIDNVLLMQALVRALKPFGALLGEGKGVALIMKGDDEANIVGLSLEGGDA